MKHGYLVNCTVFILKKFRLDIHPNLYEQFIENIIVESIWGKY